MRLSERMAARLDVDFSSTDQEGPKEIERPVRIWVPAIRVDLRTINSPDPSVKLQWRLGFLFLVLGIFLPRMVDSWL
jgi:hypothetical protein